MILFTQQMGSAWEWPKKRFEYANGLAVYEGRHVNVDAADTDPGWVIIKRAYNEFGLVTDEEQRTGTWAGRSSLGWNV